MEEFKFELTDFNAHSTQYRYDIDLVVEITSANLPRRLYLHVKSKLDKNQFVPNKISLQVSSFEQKNEQLSFIAGVFSFTDTSSVEIAYNALLNKEHKDWAFSSKWRDFAYQFRNWYKSTVELLLESYLDTFNKYAKNINNQR